MQYLRRISQLRPQPDETLLSFLRRAQIDAGYSDEKMHLLAAGVPIPDARSAERRCFDWDVLSRFFNASAEKLYSMSERAYYCRIEDICRVSSFGHRMPWAHRQGYSAHSPASLRKSPHWKRSWLKPSALVSGEDGTLLIRHCHGCGQDLADLKWGNASPVCPNCGAHLSLGPVVAAPSAIVEQAAKISARFDQVVEGRPLQKHDYGLAHFSAIWRASRLLASDVDQQFWPLRDAMLDLAGIGPLADSSDIGRRALRHVQIAIVAHQIAELDPTFCEFYWASTMQTKRAACADEIVRFKLVEFAASLGIELLPGPSTAGQTLISFASWEGVKSLSIAA